MKARLTIILLLCAIASEALSQQAAPSNCPLGMVVEADGKTDEWPLEWIDDDDKTMSYNVCSDDNNLYIRMKTADDIVRRKIAIFGLFIWMDPNGKKKRKLGLRFPTGAEATERLNARKDTHDYSKLSSSEKAEIQKEMNKSLIANLEMMELIGLADEPLISTRSGITNGIKVALVANEEGAYFYEAIIPFKAFRLSKAAISDLGIGIETGKYTPPPSKQPIGNALQRGTSYQGPRNSNLTVPSGVWLNVKFK